MDGPEHNVKSEEDRRLLCCVCDTRKLPCSESDADHFFCSKNCEKLFVLMQGIVVGNVLQSIFRDMCEDRGYRDQSELYQRLWTESSTHVPPEMASLTLSTVGEHSLLLSDKLTSEPVCCSFLENVVTSADRQVNAHVPTNKVKTNDSESDASSNEGENLEYTVSNSARCEARSKLVHADEKKKRGITDRQESTFRKSVRQSVRLASKPKTGFSVKDSTLSVSSINHSTSSEAADSRVSTNIKSEPKECDHFGGGQDEIVETDKRRVKCKRCGKLISKYYLYVHYRAKHKDHLSDIVQSSVSCSECGKQFMRKQALNAHKLKRHNHKFTNCCKHCGKGFANRLGLSWHMRQVHKLTIRQCGTCGETFENRRDYKKHRRYQHAANSHVCHICGKGFKLKNALQAHLDAHAGVKLHFCEICGDGFVRFSSLCQHKNNLHGPKKSELPFKCQLCPNTFRLQAWLDKHIVQKHKSTGGGMNADCELCQSSLQTAVPCPLHTEAIRESFVCRQCNKVFAKDTSLKAHMKQHQEPQFSCDICHKKFTYKCNMLRHRDTHSSEKPFYCDICAKQFCTKFLLASHMRMHNQDQLFKCDICGKGLTRKDYLKNHLRKMHPEAEAEQSQSTLT